MLYRDDAQTGRQSELHPEVTPAMKSGVTTGNKKPATPCGLTGSVNAPEWIRTTDLVLRSQRAIAPNVHKARTGNPLAPRVCPLFVDTSPRFEDKSYPRELHPQERAACLDSAPSSCPDWLAEPSTRIERRFAEFHRANPHVYAEFERRALQLHRAGARRIGAKAIAERIRWDINIRTLGDEYKINNSYTALYARLLIHHHPELADVIELRRRKGAA